MTIRNSTKYGIILIGVFSLLALSFLVLHGSPNDSTKFTNNTSKLLTIEKNASPAAYVYEDDSTKFTNNIDETTTFSRSLPLAKYTHKDLNKYSDTIVVGTVKEILPSKWNTIDGKQPDKAPAELNSSDLIYTDIIISVDKYVKNSLLSKEIIVRVIGGAVGNISMSLDNEPSFRSGEKVLLYLTRDTYPDTKNVGPEHLVVTGYLQGKFTLTDDGKAIGWNENENTSLEELLSGIKE